MNNYQIGVIGSTGKTGARVNSGLIKMGYATRALSRQSTPAFDWADPKTWTDALVGLNSVYVTYYPDLAVPKAAEDIRLFVEIAKAEGIEHIVLLSGRGEQGAQDAEQIVINSGINWNVVRASWFMQNFSESFMADGIRARNLVLPIPKATEPFIDVDDIAEVALAALTRPELRNELLEITGPELLSFTQCTEIISESINEHIQFTPVPVDAYLDAAKSDGLPEDIAWLINELFTEVLDGRNESTTNTIERVLGRPAKSLHEFAQSISEQKVW